ncbi:MAG TPA: DUF874 family protein, partial [Candidatus Babeliaceae bacterium]|nr:DUF874 family protein [Candidatus Babeliaceae bacterium]
KKTSTPVTMVAKNEKKTTTSHYYDSHTRSTTSHAGIPIATAINAVAPAKTPAPANKNVTPTPITPAQVQNNSQSSLLSKVKSLWPWSQKKPETLAKTQQSEEQKQVKRHYFDRYSQR